MMKLMKKLGLSTGAIALIFLLAGCGSTAATNNSAPSGIFGVINEFLGKPMSGLVTYFAHDLGLGFGWSIILITIIVRTIIFPLGVNQAKGMIIQQEKMAFMKPILEPIQARMSNATTPEEKMAAQQE